MNCVYCFVSVVTFASCIVYSTFADEQTTQISNIINGSPPAHGGVLQDLNAIVAAISTPAVSAASSFLSKEDSIEENNETMSDNGNIGGSGGAAAVAATRGVISDIAKLKKIGEILETVGSKVIPALVDGGSSLPQTAGAGVIPSTAVGGGESQVKPIGLKLIHALKQQENVNDNAVKIDGIRTEII